MSGYGPEQVLNVREAELITYDKIILWPTSNMDGLRTSG